MTASTRWLLARIVPLLGIAGLMLCLDGAVVLILAYEGGETIRGCRHRAPANGPVREEDLVITRS